MNDFQPNFADFWTEAEPFRSLVIGLRCAVMIPSSLFGVCPRPCNVQFLEVHIRAVSTQSARIGLHAKQCVFSAPSTRDVNQNMLARLHQIEPLTMNVLQVGIASGSHASTWRKRRVWRRPTRRIRRAGRRAG